MRGEGGREGERERAQAAGESMRKRFGSSLFVFSSTWACPMQIELSQECYFFYLKSSLWF